MTNPGWITPARLQVDALPPTRAGLLTALLTITAASRQLDRSARYIEDHDAARAWRQCHRATEHLASITPEPNGRPLVLPAPDPAEHDADVAGLRQLIGQAVALANELLDDTTRPLPAAHATVIRRAQDLLIGATNHYRLAAAAPRAQAAVR